MKVIAIDLQDGFGTLLEFNSDAFESLYMKGDSATLTLKSGADYCRMAMGIDWMTRDELAQAIPPAFTEYIGRQLISAVLNRKELQLEPTI